MVCTEAGIATSEGHAFASPITIWLTVAFSLLTLLAVCMNYKASKTPLALLVVLLGIALLIFSAVKGGGEALYYLGAVSMWIGVWLNGSLPALWRRGKQYAGSLVKARR